MRVDPVYVCTGGSTDRSTPDVLLMTSCNTALPATPGPPARSGRRGSAGRRTRRGRSPAADCSGVQGESMQIDVRKWNVTRSNVPMSWTSTPLRSAGPGWAAGAAGAESVSTAPITHTNAMLRARRGAVALMPTNLHVSSWRAGITGVDQWASVVTRRCLMPLIWRIATRSGSAATARCGKRAVQLLERDADLQPREMRAQAEVRTARSVSQVVVRRPGHVEALRIVERRVVVVGGAVPDDDAVAGGERLTRELGVVRDVAAHVHHRTRVADDLLDRGGVHRCRDRPRGSPAAPGDGRGATRRVRSRCATSRSRRRRGWRRSACSRWAGADDARRARPPPRRSRAPW